MVVMPLIHLIIRSLLSFMPSPPKKDPRTPFVVPAENCPWGWHPLEAKRRRNTSWGISPASLQGARIFSLASVNTSTRTKIWKHCKEKLDYMDSLVHHVWELMFWSIRCGFLHNFYSHSLCSRIALITAVSDQSHDSGVAQKKSSFCTASWWHGDTGHAHNGIGRNWTEMPLFTYVQIKIAGKFM